MAQFSLKGFTMKTYGTLWTIFAGLAALTFTSGAALSYSGEHYVTCNLNPEGDNFLALRTCGSTSCPMTYKLPPDTFLLTLEPYANNGWREVMVISGLQDESYSGPTGWVYSKYICEIRYP